MREIIYEILLYFFLLMGVGVFSALAVDRFIAHKREIITNILLSYAAFEGKRSQRKHIASLRALQKSRALEASRVIHSNRSLRAYNVCLPSITGRSRGDVR